MAPPAPVVWWRRRPGAATCVPPPWRCVSYGRSCWKARQVQFVFVPRPSVAWNSLPLGVPSQSHVVVYRTKPRCRIHNRKTLETDCHLALETCADWDYLRSGCGKTALVDALAAATGNGGNLIRLQLDDQVDAKSLLGAYVCTAVPGEFVWQPGLLTQVPFKTALEIAYVRRITRHYKPLQCTLIVAEGQSIVHRRPSDHTNAVLSSPQLILCMSAT